MTSFLSRLCVGAVTLCVALAASVEPPGAAQIASSCTIAGAVVDAASARMFPDVTVVLSRLGTPSRAVLSDAEGRFSFTSVAPGDYSLAGFRPAFVPTDPGEPMRVSCPGGVIDARLALVKGAVIAGVVSDERGRPAAGVLVGLDTGRTVMSGHSGEFRFFGLPSGAYVLSATPPASTLATSGIVTRTAETNDRLLRELANGRFGHEGPAASTAELPRPQAQATAAKSYFPGTTRRDEAVPVKVKAGEEANAADFVLASAPSFKISGVVFSPSGAPTAGASVQILRVGDGTNVGGQSTGAQGQFAVQNLVGGPYRVWVRTVGPGTTLSQSSVSIARLATAWAEVDVAVAADVSDLRVYLQPVSSAIGTVVLQHQAGLALPLLARARVQLTRTEGEGTGNRSFDVPFETRVTLAGKFQIDHLTSGRFKCAVIIDGDPRWILESVTVDGTVLGSPVIEILPGRQSLTGVTLTVVRR